MVGHVPGERVRTMGVSLGSFYGSRETRVLLFCEGTLQVQEGCRSEADLLVTADRERGPGIVEAGRILT
jgi:hypothetical protein